MNLRLETFAVVVVVAILLFFAWPRRGDRRTREDPLTGLQAVELRVEEDARTRTVRAPVPLVIGRAPSATLVIPDAQVSRLHARIDFIDDMLAIRDLNSRNGTLVNARPIDAPVELRDGDEIDIGTTRIVFCGLGSWK